MSGRTPINITSRIVYTNADLSDDQFNIFADGNLVFGNDLLTDDAITMSGLARIRAPVTIDDSLTLDDTVTLVNASVVTQNGNLLLGQSSSDSVTVRNIVVQQFSGLITGFDQNGATNDQLVVNTATWHYQDFVANSGGTGGSLMFTNGSAETAVTLTGSYDPTGFVGVVSGNQTTITYTG